MSPTVAALYVAKDGAYYGLEGVDPWDEERDARNYTGPHSVVAHPPCARWSRLAGFTEARWGYKRGHDGGCFKAALVDVRRFGGVLEHPAYSAAWTAFDLPKPQRRDGWTLGSDGSATCYVEQGRYGLPVKKATWAVRLWRSRSARAPVGLHARPRGDAPKWAVGWHRRLARLLDDQGQRRHKPNADRVSRCADCPCSLCAPGSHIEGRMTTPPPYKTNPLSFTNPGSGS